MPMQRQLRAVPDLQRACPQDSGPLVFSHVLRCGFLLCTFHSLTCFGVLSLRSIHVINLGVWILQARAQLRPCPLAASKLVGSPRESSFADLVGQVQVWVLLMQRLHLPARSRTLVTRANPRHAPFATGAIAGLRGDGASQGCVDDIVDDSGDRRCCRGGAACNGGSRLSFHHFPLLI